MGQGIVQRSRQELADPRVRPRRLPGPLQIHQVHREALHRLPPDHRPHPPAMVQRYLPARHQQVHLPDPTQCRQRAQCRCSMDHAALRDGGRVAAIDVIPTSDIARAAHHWPARELSHEPSKQHRPRCAEDGQWLEL